MHSADTRDEARSMRAHRDALIDSISRWRPELRAISGPTTLWLGIAERASKRVTSMLMLAVAVLIPGFRVTDHTTPGDLCDALEHAGARLRADCVRRPGRLLRPTELKALSDLTRDRNWLAHLEEKAGIRSPEQVGQLETAEVLRILDAAEAFCGMTLIEEIICRETDGG